jgi:peptide/nickel transport system substrate-binding protein
MNDCCLRSRGAADREARREMVEPMRTTKRLVVALVAVAAMALAACSSSGSGTAGSGSGAAGSGAAGSGSAGSGSGSGSAGTAGQGSAASPTTETGTPVSGGDLVIARAADALAMNNTNTFDNNSIFVFEQIMEPLFTVTNDGKSTKPWLATGYQISDGGLTYTVKLRQGVKFSNGDPMTSADVKFSIDAATATGQDGWGYINAAIDSVSAPDPNTVVFKLKYQGAPFIADLALFSNAIVPKDYDGQSADEFYQHPVGTGPFEWDKWDKGKALTLKKNPNYWQQGKPYLDTVTWNVVPDGNARKLQLQGGQASIDEYPDWSTMDDLKATSGITATTFPSTQLDYLTFNEQRKPFQDVHVRRAIAAAIDRQAIVKAVLFGNGSAANSILMPGVPYYDKSTPGITLNMDLAKSEMAKSSVPKGFSTTILVRSGDSTQASVAQILQGELEPLGIKLDIQQLDPTAVKTARNAGNFDILIGAWTMDIPDPDEWTSFAVDPDGGSHAAYTWRNNPEIVKINKEAQQTTDTAKRQQLYSQLQKLAAQDSSMAYLYYSPYAYAWQNKVHGFFVTPLGNYHLEDVWLSK